MQVENVEGLGGEQLSAVLALNAAAEAVDLVAPLSEQVLLAARGGRSAAAPSGAASNSRSGAGSGTDRPHLRADRPHFLAYDGPHLAGYAHLERGLVGEAATAEVAVDPADRRRGVGTALIRALEAAARPDGHATAPETEALQIWSHGHVDGARAFAARAGYSNVRELWVMRRSLRTDADPRSAGADSLTADAGSLLDARLPEGFRPRAFVIGQDEEAWLRVNAQAFAEHAEQGRMTRHDLDLRIAEPWFDAEGFILVEDTRGAAPVLAASHWTKVVSAADPKGSRTQGEVYVVGVDPAYQGLGLGRAVTVLGLAHLRARGLAEAMLYVDADNKPAVATYDRLGFTRVGVDVMYSTRRSPASATIGT